jgi:hypothetical protein
MLGDVVRSDRQRDRGQKEMQAPETGIEAEHEAEH